ncbi:ATP/maltotriose-dependent transcriptional regulator MalT [Thermosporothrix hazakensis]|jgi:LuxR family maltose regulon positive regulatory protein|uniref:ATP/maltotriose-dependent transcriptional regulator MalT n=1 Tax=Thermosporothrix hazakensis TaxID=644383 RepID=A0A326UM64_THEHA|nr:LuxR C-terminal-related transcriptional regulator [Thermosporothrix hazakensis]PZW34353.1 ATP/maltotriose-dependent transcriptional regulator MalT [Thermosporothrix hazakensis]GCE46098.1 helix-turn-helix transcriptional regulator [Thermosporothrix hazakensis]
MARTTLPHVIDDCLHLQETPPSTITIGSAGWFRWLEENTSFSFRHPLGTFTGRRELHQQKPYWYAYHKREGKTLKAYLGKAEDLTAERLLAVATLLFTRTTLRQPASEATSSHIVARPYLFQHCLRSLHKKLILLSAPAGWGKSTILQEWQRLLQQQKVQTLVLTPHEAGFQASLNAALTEHAEIAIHSHEQALETLRRLQRVVLFLDQNEITCADEIIHFLQQAPAGCHLILATRHPSTLARLSVQNLISELSLEQLAFRPEDIRTLVQQLTGTEPTEETVNQLAELTGGWPLGIRWLLTHCPFPITNDELATVLEHDRSLQHFVDEEILQPLPKPWRDFLLQISILDELDEQRCNAVRERTDSHTLLASLAQAHLFLQSTEHGTLRLIPLLARVLRQQTDTAPLHARASRWYRQRGQLQQALFHAHQSADEQLVQRLQLHSALLHLFKGQDVPAHTSPLLAALAVQRFDEAERQLATLEDTDLISLVQLYLAGQTGKRYPIEYVSEQPDVRAWCATLAPIMTGDVAEYPVRELLASNGHQTSLALGALAFLLLQQGKLQQAASTLEQLRERLEAETDSLLYALGMSELALERHDLPTAAHFLLQGQQLLHATHYCHAALSLRHTIAYTRFYLAQSQYTRALQLASTIEEQATWPQLAHQLAAAQRAWVFLSQEQFDKAEYWLTICKNNSVALPELLQTWIAQLEIRLHPQSAYRHLPLLKQAAQAHQRWTDLLTYELFQAHLFYTTGAQAAAQATLERAVLRARPEQHIRPFLEGGQTIYRLLRLLQRGAVAPAFVRTLITHFHKVEPRQSSALSREASTLTRREHDVLQLLVKGASNRTIARELVISEGTVKKHVFNICSKLNAQNRAQVIAQILQEQQFRYTEAS